ncbi:glutaminyl cyclase [Rhynchospora pubera]|uniref:Glutaminyl cyclase n=1 Tax=Rhynchospora pubera TaxID=906938 RepID=A0AAV8ETK1_9POAL|nr:glutaminyl cyclase [Rhynchospora pubera]
MTMPHSSKRNQRRRINLQPPSMASPHPSFSRSRSPPLLSRLRRRPPAAALFLLSLLLLYATWRAFLAPSPHHLFYTFDVVNVYPHDPNAFTQGLVYAGNDTLFESTGLYKKSSVREVHLQSGKVRAHHKMDGSLFGEGLTLLGERLYQVLWLKNEGFIYDRNDFTKHEKFTHEMHDGWGLATDGEVLYGSDGSSSLYHLDPSTFQALKRVTVKYHDREIINLNELEYINGEIWANIWLTDCIARISHKDGQVVGWILLHELRDSLLKSGHQGFDCLNGIAWDKENNRLFVTGKLWPKLYEIKLRPITGQLERGVEDLCPIKSYL